MREERSQPVMTKGEEDEDDIDINALIQGFKN